MDMSNGIGSWSRRLPRAS